MKVESYVGLYGNSNIKLIITNIFISYKQFKIWTIL